MIQPDNISHSSPQKSAGRHWPHQRVVTLVGLALLLILVSASILAFTQMDRIVSTRVAATSIVHVRTISTAYVATASTSARGTVLAQTLAWATAQAIATATTTITDATSTAAASTNPYPPHTGTLALDDTLRNNSANYWNIGDNKQGGVSTFTGNALHVKEARQDSIIPCLASPTFSNFVYQVQVRLLSGDAAGITFRYDGQKGTGYLFLLYANGSYEIDKASNYTATIITSGSNGAIKTGLNQTNLVAVIAHGSTMELYVNGQHVDSLNDSSYNSGLIGASVSNQNSGSSEAAFNNARVWTL